MLTRFGIATRKLQLDRGLTLRRMAESLQLSSAFVSAIETGRKTIPDGYVEAVAEALAASDAEVLDLRRAVDETRTKVNVGDLKGADRVLLASFARNLDRLPPEFLETCRELLAQFTPPPCPRTRKRTGNKESIADKVSKNGTEFGRSFRGAFGRFSVDAISDAAIVELTYRLRRRFTRSSQLWFPIVEFLELVAPKILPDFDLDICDLLTIGGEEGKYIHGTNTIMVREDVYEAACDGVGWARFVLGHEFGHFMLHRLQPKPRRARRYDPEQDPEVQSNIFSGSLFISSHHLDTFSNAADAAVKCGMSFPAAEKTLSQLTQLVERGELRFLERSRHPTNCLPMSNTSASCGVNNKPRIFVIHGHDPCHMDLELCLRQIGAEPLFFDQLPKPGSLTVVELLEKHLPSADAAIVLLTPDDEGRERGEAILELRARQNVLIEAGYAVIAKRIRTILVALGGVSIPSDFAGIHRVEEKEWTASVITKIAVRLSDMGLAIDPSVLVPTPA